MAAMASMRSPSRVLSPLSPLRQTLGSPTLGAAKKGAPAKQEHSRMAKAMQEWKGPLQFVEEFPCRYCGSTQLSPLKKGLDGKARRQLASVAVSQICKLQCPQHSLMLRVTDKGIGGINSKKSVGVFFESANSIQYLLAGRKNAKKGNSTYVLVFAASQDPENRNSVVHLVRFSQREHVNELYKSVHRMMQDSMFAQLFDIHSEEQQRAFDPTSVLGEAQRADDNIQSLMEASMSKAMSRIESLRLVGEASEAGDAENGSAPPRRKSMPAASFPMSPNTMKTLDDQESLDVEV